MENFGVLIVWSRYLQLYKYTVVCWDFMKFFDQLQNSEIVNVHISLI